MLWKISVKSHNFDFVTVLKVVAVKVTLLKMVLLMISGGGESGRRSLTRREN